MLRANLKGSVAGRGTACCAARWGGVRWRGRLEQAVTGASARVFAPAEGTVGCALPVPHPN